MQTRLSLALLLVAITACTEGALPVAAGKGSPVPDATQSTVSVAPPELVADGVASSTITVTVKDKNGQPLEGVAVSFSATGEENTLTPQALTNAQGVATGTIASTRAGTKRLTLRAGPASKAVELTQRPDVKFNPGPPTRLTFLVQPASAAAGQTLAAVQVAAEDARGNRAAAPVTVGLELQGGTTGATLGGTASRAVAAGVAAFNDLSIQRAGTGYTLRATAPGLTEAVSTAFNITAGAISTATTTFEVDKTEEEANGTALITATLVARDAFENPLADQAVTIAATGTGNTLEPTEGNTNAQGRFVATLRSTKAEAKTLSATLGGTALAQTRNVTFRPGPPARLTFLTQPPASIQANAPLTTAQAPVQVAVADAQGNPLMGAVPVALSLTGGTAGATLGGTTTRNASAGVAAFSDLFVRRAGAGYKLRATTASLAPAESNAFEVTADVASATHSTVVAAPDSVVADGTATSTITVTAMDQFSNPVAGQTVDVSATGSNNTLSATSGATDSTGKFAVTLRSTRAEVKTVSAKVNNAAIAVTPQVTFTPGPPARLSFTQQPPATATAGQVFAPALGVEVLDAQGNRVVAAASQLQVTLTLNVAGIELFGTKAKTSASGLVSFDDLNVRRAGVGYSLNASAPGVLPVESNTFDITPGAPAVARSSFVADPATLQASTTLTSNLTVTVLDQYDNPVGGKNVTLTQTSGSSGTLSLSDGPTNGQGKLTVTYRSTAAGLKEFRADVADLASPLTASLTITPAPLDRVLLVGSPETTVESDGTVINLKATALDFFGNVISGLPVTMAFTSPTFTGRLPVPAVTNGTTNAAGEFSTTLSSDFPDTGYGEGTVTANVGTAPGNKTASLPVTFMRPSVVPSALQVLNPVEGCVSLEYTVAQEEAARADIRVDYEVGGSWKAATQAGSLTGSGINGVATSLAGTKHTFLWNSTADLPASDAATRVRITTVLPGAINRSLVLENVALKNGPRFGNVQRVTAGTAPRALAVADMNRDGRQDGVVLNPTGNVFTVMHGDGAGSFALGATSAVDSGATLLLVEDFNRDGRPDVVTAGGSTVQFQLTLNTAGGYVAQAPVSLSTRAVALAAGDFTRDGKVDLVVADTAGMVRVYAGNGSGSLSSTSSMDAGSITLKQLATGDFNRDGKLDVAAADGSGVRVLLNSGTSSFSAPTVLATGAGANALRSDDLDADGDADLVVATATGYVVALGSADGTFSVQPAVGVGGQPSDLALKDLDGDTRPELMVAGVGSDLLVRKGLGGTFSASAVLAAGGATVAVGAADLNGDGRTDVLATRPGDDSLVRVLNTQVARCEGSLVAAQQYAVDAAPSAVALADFDGDGRVDMAVASANANTVNISRGMGNGKFSTPVVSVALGAGATKPLGVVAGDFNGDKMPDLATANSTSNSVSVLLNNGSGTFAVSSTTATPIVGAAPRGLAAGDFDKDGKLDVVVSNSNGGNVALLYGDGAGGMASGKAKTVAVAGAGQPYAVVAADFDRNGLMDFATANFSGGNVSVVLGDTTVASGFRGPTNFGVASGPRALGFGHFNADAHLDLAVVNSSTESVSILLGNSAGGFTASTSVATGARPLGLAVGDVDADGDTDLVTASNGTAGLSLVLGDGQGGFVLSGQLMAGSGLNAVQGTDLDGDGRMDLVTTVGGNEQGSGVDNRVAVVRTAGANLRAVSPLTASTSGGTLAATLVSGTSADVNRDGVPDLLMASNGSRALVQWTGERGGGFKAGSLTEAAGGNLTGLAVGDVDGNGTPDALVSSSANNNVTVLLGDGALGLFTPHAASPRTTGGTPAIVELDDIDSDGDLDLIALGDGIRTFANNGTGTFAAPNTVTAPAYAIRGVVFADFNGDGRRDIAMCGANNSQVDVLLATAGGFQPTRVTSLASLGAVDPNALAAADVNGDGRMDLAVSVLQGGTYSVVTMLGLGDGLFSTASLPRVTVPVLPKGLALTDVDGDAKVDLAIYAVFSANSSAPQVDSLSVLRGDATGAFSLASLQSWAVSPGVTLNFLTSSMGIADLNRDGLPDLFTGGSSGASVVYAR